MGMCNACGEVYGALDMQGQYCTKCYEKNKETILEELKKEEQAKVKMQEPTDNTVPMIFGLMGAFIMIVGIFAPIVSVPIVGEINYFNHGKGDGMIVALIGVISIVLVLTKQYVWLALSGLSSLAVLGYTAMTIQNHLGSLRIEITTSSTNEAFQGLANSLIAQVTFEWGFALLIVASIMVLISAFVKGKQ